MVDESLALGVLGVRGRGACEHFGLTDQDVEIRSSSLGALVTRLTAHTLAGSLRSRAQVLGRISPGRWCCTVHVSLVLRSRF